MPDPNPTKTAPKVLIYACSGSSDAGELADHTARALSRQGLGEMSCLAGVGGRVKPLLSRARQADEIVVIDGCPLHCALHTLAAAGFQRVRHLSLHQLGVQKGRCSPVDLFLSKTLPYGEALLRAIQQKEQMP